MRTETSAGIAARATRRLEKARRVIIGIFVCTAFGIGVPALTALLSAYRDGDIGIPLMILAGAGLTAFLVFYVQIVRDVLAGEWSIPVLVASGTLAFALSIMAVTDPVWIMIGPFWASAVALGLASHRQVVALCAGVSALGALLSLFAAERSPHWYMWPVMFVILGVLCAFTVGANLVQKWFWDLIKEAYAAREAHARLAVTEERLRFARDLHDLLGHNLSLIAVKSELAIRMADGDVGRAKVEMADVRQAAREGLREVRAAARGYRVVELDGELAGVRAVLEAAGVRCVLTEPPAGLPPEVRGVLAWVVREGATNVLKHSDARRCEISFSAYEGSVVLEMVNDGARTAGTEPGTGLTGLRERVAVLDGGLTAGPAGAGRFLLRVAIPFREPEPGTVPTAPAADAARASRNPERAA